MRPDLNEEWKVRMEGASLNEVMPDFDKEREWGKLAHKLQEGTKKRVALYWYRAAAAVLLLAGCGAYIWLAGNNDTNMQTAQAMLADTIYTATVPVAQHGSEVATVAPEAIATTETAQPIIPRATAATTTKDTGRKKDNLRSVAAQNGTEQFFNYYRANEYVCNGTQCPLEICIVQTFKCKNDKPSAVATCSTLAPDEARQLRYKALDKKGKDCKVTVDEIRIKRVSTGETIVLNANSKPSTAEELFSCITGEVKCNILAGIFDADCNNHCKPHDLTIYNNQGNLTLQ